MKLGIREWRLGEIRLLFSEAGIFNRTHDLATWGHLSRDT